MKKLLFVPMLLIMLTGTIVAQSQQEKHKTEQNAVEKNEHMLMKDGKMLHTMDGKEMEMQNDMTLKNGMIIKPNGSYQLKNGKQLQLRNGECMDMNGMKYSSERMFQNILQMKHGVGMHGQNMHSGGGHHQNMNGNDRMHH